jgi:hypothetical protein
MRTRQLSFIVLLLTTACAQGARTPSPAHAPRDGRELLAQMHDAYAGKWYRTLTFVQKTTINRPGQPEQIQTWYESLLSPNRLRIDFGDLAEGNGVIYTADSLYVVRAGKQVRAVANGNPFLPFVAGVYAQPIETTLQQLAPYHFDLSLVRPDTWQGRPVYVVGAKSADDTTSAQFWVDRERLVALRMILALSPVPNAPPMDIHLDSYEPVAGGWLATNVAMSSKGAMVQQEQYSDWKGDVNLPAEFFDAAHWTSTPHWAARKP